MAVSRINEAGLNINQYGNRNLIINGAMQVSQRGDSTGVSTQAYYGPDRYSLGINGRDQFVLTISTTSDAPDGYSNAYKIQTTTAETSITDTEYLMVRQIIEAQNLQHLAYGTSDAKQLTASFWVKSSVAATYAVFLYQYDGNRNIGSTYTINSANTWEYKTVTFAGDTGGTINDDNGHGMYLAFMIAVGPDMSDTDNTSWGSYTGGRLGFGHSTAANAVVTTTNATWQLTGVQLEVGDTATDFEHRTFADELARCLRYYEKLGGSGANGNYAGLAVGYSGSAATGGPLYVKASPKRTNPTLTTTGTLRIISALTSGTFALSGDSYINTSGSGYFNTTSFSPTITAGHGAMITANNDADAGIILDAEL